MAPETALAIRKAHDTPETRAALKQLRVELTREATPTEIITYLVALSVHYWTPDLTESQQKSKFQDFCYDLKGVTVRGIRDACTAWRQSENVHFPKPGQMLALCRDDIRTRAEDERGLDRLEAILDGEPPRLELKVASPQTIAAILEKHGYTKKDRGDAGSDS